MFENKMKFFDKKMSDERELHKEIEQVRSFIEKKDFEESYKMILDMMYQYPHSPIPHNLFGIQFEMQGNHLMAMKHFRVAWDLEPTYLPARQNLEVFGTFLAKGTCAYDSKDCIDFKG